MFAADKADRELSLLARFNRRDRNDRAIPERRGAGKADAMLSLVARALIGVPLEFHIEIVCTISS